jgi:hypothetical protein
MNGPLVKREDNRPMVTREVICLHCLGAGQVQQGVCLICGDRGKKTITYPAPARARSASELGALAPNRRLATGD